MLDSEGEPDGCRLIVDFIPILHFKATRAVQTNLSSKISFHFCNDCRIFCEGEWEKNIIRGFGLVSIIGLGNLSIINIIGQTGLIGPSALSARQLVSLIGFIGLGGHNGVISLVSHICIDGLIGRIGLINSLQFKIEMKPS